VADLGVTTAFGQGLVRVGGGGALGTILVMTVGTVLSANVINNVPMTLLMIAKLRTLHTAASTHQAHVYGTILGADLGPNLTTFDSPAARPTANAAYPCPRPDRCSGDRLRPG